MAIHIIADSTSDITQKEAAQLGIDILPLSVIFGDETFLDGVDMTNVEFYQRLEIDKNHPTTSQVTIGAFAELFASDKFSEEDDIIVITLAEKLSGTYQSAVIAKEGIQNRRIHLIDSASATSGIALLVRRAIQMKDEGKTAEEIITEIEELKGRVRIYAAPSNLKSLYKGGRLSGTGAVAGTLLGIKPVISVKDGVVSVVSKPRGSKQAFKYIADRLHAEGVMAGTDVIFLHGDAKDVVEGLVGEVKANIGDITVKDSIIGPVIGVHIGKGACGVAFIAERNI